MRTTKVMSAAAVVVSVLAVGGGTAYADHAPALGGNRKRVLRAPRRKRRRKVRQPALRTGPENRQHPLHVLVHLGEPGQHIVIGVAGTASDPCLGGDYVND